MRQRNKTKNKKMGKEKLKKNTAKWEIRKLEGGKLKITRKEGVEMFLIQFRCLGHPGKIELTLLSKGERKEWEYNKRENERHLKESLCQKRKENQ